MINGQSFDEMISFAEIRPDEVQGIGKGIMASSSSSLRSNQAYRKLNNVKALIHWCRRRQAMGKYLVSRLFTEIEMNRCREELDMKEDSQPETSIKKPDKFKPIKFVQWSKEFENHVQDHKNDRSFTIICDKKRRETSQYISHKPIA